MLLKKTGKELRVESLKFIVQSSKLDCHIDRNEVEWRYPPV